MLAPALALLLASAPALAARPVKDLKGQFPDAALRDQGPTGGCHVFTTISLIEAALYRRHGLHLALSEADLFVGKVLSDPDYYERARRFVTLKGGAEAAYTFVESGSPFDDLEYARANGVAYAKTSPWSAFAARYAEFKKARMAEVDAGRARSHIRELDQMQEQAGQESERIGRDEASGYSDRIAQIARVNLQRIETKIGADRREGYASFHAFMDQIAGKTPAEAEALLLGEAKTLAGERKMVKTMAAPFRVRKRDFAPQLPGPTTPDPDKACRAAGADRRLVLLATLNRDIPVSVSMDVGELPEWGKQTAGAKHAFTITGYDVGDDGAIILKSRNSWGGDNPDVPDSRFCRIVRLVTVLTDLEK